MKRKVVDDGRNIIILSDRKAGNGAAAIPSLLVRSAVHHHLIRTKKRTRTGIIIESGEPRKVMHYALLIGVWKRMPLIRISLLPTIHEL